MKNYNYLTKKEIDEMIADYEEEKLKLLKCCKVIIKILVLRTASEKSKELAN